MKNTNEKIREYRRSYSKENIRYKRMNFNIKKEEDVKLLDWLNNRPEGVTAYLKKLILRDIRKKEERKEVLHNEHKFAIMSRHSG